VPQSMVLLTHLDTATSTQQIASVRVIAGYTGSLHALPALLVFTSKRYEAGPSQSHSLATKDSSN
jgi:hypothetical protein